MRLWHEALISQLPRPQLLGKHRECCALRGNGWGRKHETVYPFALSSLCLSSLDHGGDGRLWLQGQSRVAGQELPWQDLPSLSRLSRGKAEKSNL